MEALILYDKNNPSKQIFLSSFNNEVHLAFYLSYRNNKIQEMQFPSLLILITIGDELVRIYIYFINDR